MSDLRDFFGTHPTPEAPRPREKADPGRDAFLDSTARSGDWINALTRTPAARAVRGRGREMRLVDRSVCKFPCDAPGHNHTGPVMVPEPELDETMQGWTVQHIPADRSSSIVAKRCVLCWELHDDLGDHDCQVLAIVNG